MDSIWGIAVSFVYIGRKKKKELEKKEGECRMTLSDKRFLIGGMQIDCRVRVKM